jgi:hypothetical protein
LFIIVYCIERTNDEVSTLTTKYPGHSPTTGPPERRQYRYNKVYALRAHFLLEHFDIKPSNWPKAIQTEEWSNYTTDQLLKRRKECIEVQEKEKERKKRTYHPEMKDVKSSGSGEVHLVATLGQLHDVYQRESRMEDAFTPTEEPPQPSNDEAEVLEILRSLQKKGEGGQRKPEAWRETYEEFVKGYQLHPSTPRDYNKVHLLTRKFRRVAEQILSYDEASALLMGPGYCRLKGIATEADCNDLLEKCQAAFVLGK